MPTSARSRWLYPLALVLVAFALVSVHVASYTVVSPLDEPTFFDSVIEAPAPTRSGARLGQEAMAEAACRGMGRADLSVPPCLTPDEVAAGARYNPADFLYEGYNSASGYIPIWAAITKPIATAVRSVLGLDSFLTAVRLVGGLWLAAGLLASYALGRRLRIGRLVLTAVLSLVACFPVVLYPSSLANPDATTLLCGAGLVLAMLWWEKNPARRWWLPVLVSGLVVGVKTVNLLLVLMCAAYVVLRIVASRRAGVADAEADKDADTGRPWRRAMVWGGLGIGAAVMAVALSWPLVVSALALPDAGAAPLNSKYHATSFPFAGLASHIGWFLYNNWNLGSPVPSATIGMWLQRVGSIAITVGAVAAGFWGSRDARRRALGQAFLVTALIGGPFMVLFGYVSSHSYQAIPSRYGISLLPAMAVLAAGWLGPRWARITAGVVAALAVTLTIAGLLLTR